MTILRAVLRRSVGIYWIVQTFAAEREETDMEKNRDSMMQTLKFEVLHMEKKNLRSKAKTDQRMSEELQKIIKEYARGITE